MRSGTSMHLVSSSEISSSQNGAASVRSGRTGRSAKSQKSTGGETATLGGKSKRPKSIAPTVPEHKIKFEEFHNQVRRIISSRMWVLAKQADLILAF